MTAAIIVIRKAKGDKIMNKLVSNFPILDEKLFKSVFCSGTFGVVIVGILLRLSANLTE